MPHRPLAGLRLLSLGLNLPGPLAAQQARRLGARVRKIEPPGGDPVALLAPAVYAELHEGVSVRQLDLADAGLRPALDFELARADVLLTSFRPSALRRMGLAWAALRRRHPALWQVAIVGELGQPEAPGHDLSYQAGLGLLGEALPVSLWADCAGAQQALLALHQVQLGRLAGLRPRCLRVGLADALAVAASPRRWGLTAPGGLLGGAHAGYQVYACRDGRVAVAALEPKFAARLASAAGLGRGVNWQSAASARQLRQWFAARSCEELRRMALEQDLPLEICA